MIDQAPRITGTKALVDRRSSDGGSRAFPRTDLESWLRDLGSSRHSMNASATVFRVTATSDHGARRMTKARIRRRIKEYEREFEMSSDVFLEHVATGAAPDSFAACHWRALLAHLA